MTKFVFEAAEQIPVEDFDDLIVRLAAAHSAQVAVLEDEARDLRVELEVFKHYSDQELRSAVGPHKSQLQRSKAPTFPEVGADLSVWANAGSTVIDLDLLQGTNTVAPQSNGEPHYNGDHTFPAPGVEVDDWYQSRTSLPLSFKSAQKPARKLPQLEHIAKAPVAMDVFDKTWLHTTAQIEGSPDGHQKSPKVKVAFHEGKEDSNANGWQNCYSGVNSVATHLLEEQEFGSFNEEETAPSSILTPGSADGRKSSLIAYPTSPSHDSSVLEKWQIFVERVLSTPQRELLQLKLVWIQPESFMIKAARNNQQVDIFLAAPIPHATRRSFWRGSAGFAGFTEDARAPYIQTNWNRTGCKSVLHEYEERDWEGFVDSFVMDPQCGRRIVWAMLGMLLMIYDLIMMPMGVFDFGSHWTLTFIQYMAQVFWTTDILVSFFTGVYVDSELEMRFRVVARHYSMSWLPVDIVVTLPLWFAIIAGSEESTSGASAFKSTKFLKLLRFLRLARLIKFDHLLSETLEFINSPTVLLVIGMLKLIFGLVLLNHINACLWYAVGDSSGGWTEKQKYAQRSWRYQYLSSMHWALTQFQGTSEILPGELTVERLYAVGTVLVALILLSAFVSRLTNMMISLQNLQQARTYEQRVVRGFLSNHNISSKLAVRCKKWVAWKQKVERSTEHDKEVQAILPKMLMMELLDEVRNPTLVSHAFFMAMHDAFPKVTRSLCFQALYPVTPSPGEIIFHPGDHGHRMFFIVAGNLLYKIINTQPNPHHRFATRPSGFAAIELIQKSVAENGNDSRGSVEELSRRGSVDSAFPHDKYARLSKGGFLSEGTLWVKTWEHHGELAVERDASMLVLDSTNFAEVISMNNVAHASVVLYARRFVASMNVYGKVHDDIIDPYFFLGDEDDNDDRNRRSSQGSQGPSNRSSSMSMPGISHGASTLASWSMKRFTSSPRKQSVDSSAASA